MACHQLSCRVDKGRRRGEFNLIAGSACSRRPSSGGNIVPTRNRVCPTPHESLPLPSTSIRRLLPFARTVVPRGLVCKEGGTLPHAAGTKDARPREPDRSNRGRDPESHEHFDTSLLDDFDVANQRSERTSPAPIDHRMNCGSRPLQQGLHASVATVAHPALYAVAAGNLCTRLAVADTLDASRHEHTSTQDRRSRRVHGYTVERTLLAGMATRSIQLGIQECHRPDERGALFGAQMLEGPDGQGSHDRHETTKIVDADTVGKAGQPSTASEFSAIQARAASS